MTEQEFDIITDRLSGFTEHLYYHVMGEPLTHPLLPSFIRLASSKGYKSVITTNGTLLDSVGDALISAGVYKVNISVHSFEDGDDADYRRYITQCLDFADRASEAGVLVILRLWNNGYDNGRNADIEKLMRERFCGEEWKAVSNGARIRHKLHLEYGERFSWPDLNACDSGEHVFCYGLYDHFSVLCDGTVVPCCLDRNGELALGNIFSDELDGILSSRRAENIREGFRKRSAKEELCRKCGYAHSKFS